ncbi:GTPase activating protein (GAP) for Rho1p, variant 2 [Mucor circinelloides]
MNNNAYKNTEHRIEAFQKLVQCLPPPHQHLLLYLLDTLSLFATAASETKMNISNLAAVFCPGILRHPDHNTPVQYKISQYVIEFLIEFQSLFTMQLLVPTKQKKSSTFSSSGGDVPPVPLLLPSSYPSQQPPPVPLHVVNPSAPSELSLSIRERNTSSLIESPLEMNAQDQRQNSIDAAVAREASISTKNTLSNSNQQSFMQKAAKVTRPYYHTMLQKLTELRRAMEPWIAKPAALLICISVLLVTLMIIVYEAYLAFTFCSFEPYLFFAGLVSYWGLLYKGLPPSPPSTPVVVADAQAPNVPHQAVTDKLPLTDAAVPDNAEDEDMFPEAVMDADAEMAMMQDESIMSEWRDLLTRAWKVNESDDSDAKTISTATGADDMVSVMSRSSRFNEEEDFAPAASISSSEEEDEELGFDPDTLEMYLSQYDQIKRDAELAKKLQIEEQKARDENNPFVVEDIAIGKSRGMNNASTSKEVDNNDNVTTPTDDKEEWKIRIFPR